jgi:hypothetical protein
MRVDQKVHSEPKLSTISTIAFNHFDHFSTKSQKIKFFIFFRIFWIPKIYYPLYIVRGLRVMPQTGLGISFFFRCSQGGQSRPKKLVDIFVFDQNFGRLFYVSTKFDQIFWSTFFICGTKGVKIPIM